jgi:hypothetical protein
MLFIHPNQPINKKCTLNKKLRHWWLAHPQFCRGLIWHDLLGVLDGSYVAMSKTGLGLKGNDGNRNIYGSVVFDGIASRVKLNPYISNNTLSNTRFGFTIFIVLKLNINQIQRNIWTKCTSGTIFGWSIGIDDTSSNKFKFVTGNGASMDTLVSRSSIPINTWSTVAFACDGGNGANANKKYIYINGKLDKDSPFNQPLIYSGSSPSSIGFWEAGNAQFFNGAIASLMFYDRFLSTDEIYLLHQSYKKGFTPQLNILKPYIFNTNLNSAQSSVSQYVRRDFGGDLRGVYRGAARGVV